MLETHDRGAAATAIALSWIEGRGIELRSWPPEGEHAKSDVQAHPVLYLVEPGFDPPTCGELEDWIRKPLDKGELHARAERMVGLARRSAAHLTYIDENDVLRVGEHLAILSPLEARLLRPLIDKLGQVVQRDDLIGEVWPEGPPSSPRALDNRVKSLRSRIASLPLELHTLRSRGLLLERLPG